MSTLIKISEAASIALHTAVLLASHPKKIMSTKEIADLLQISEAHLSKVLQRLHREGIVESVRGPKGGFKLSSNPSDVTLLDVYEAIEGRFKETGCLLPHPFCAGTGTCLFGGLLQKIDHMVEDHLSGTTLASASLAIDTAPEDEGE